jgi:hypothetical protein
VMVALEVALIAESGGERVRGERRCVGVKHVQRFGGERGDGVSEWSRGDFGWTGQRGAMVCATGGRRPPGTHKKQPENGDRPHPDIA